MALQERKKTSLADYLKLRFNLETKPEDACPNTHQKRLTDFVDERSLTQKHNLKDPVSLRLIFMEEILEMDGAGFQVFAVFIDDEGKTYCGHWNGSTEIYVLTESGVPEADNKLIYLEQDLQVLKSKRLQRAKGYPVFIGKNGVPTRRIEAEEGKTILAEWSCINDTGWGWVVAKD